MSRKKQMRVDGHLGGNVIGGDPETLESALWSWLVDTFCVQSVVDFGCGSGIALREFRDLGLFGVGVDGLVDNCKDAGMSIQHDFTTGPIITYGFDLAWCCEVAEHIDEQYVGHLIESLCCCNVVAMTAAINPDGYHHVNLKFEPYWIDLLEKHGFSYMTETTEEARAIAKHVLFKNTGMIFI